MTDVVNTSDAAGIEYVTRITFTTKTQSFDPQVDRPLELTIADHVASIKDDPEGFMSSFDDGEYDFNVEIVILDPNVDND